MIRPRFLQLADVAEVLNISAAQAYALVRSGALSSSKVGGRGQWRVERVQLEHYIAAAYRATAGALPFWPKQKGRRVTAHLLEVAAARAHDHDAIAA